jgi:hypothetical protein
MGHVPSVLPVILNISHFQMDTSQNSSLSQITQFTTITVSSPDNCLTAERRQRRRRNPLRHFAISLQRVSVCLLAGSKDVTMCLLHKLILLPPAQISFCVRC